MVAWTGRQGVSMHTTVGHLMQSLTGDCQTLMSSRSRIC